SLVKMLKATLAVKNNVDISTNLKTVCVGCNPKKTQIKYTVLRLKNVPHRRFFLQYEKGKYTVQVVGINQFPVSYVELPHPEGYTGYNFRISSDSLLIDSGANFTVLQLKRHGGWKSSSVAESYVEECIEHKVDVSQ
ncbi:hypothetical protein BDFB_012899, partial [Asbolus verrucosus]